MANVNQMQAIASHKVASIEQDASRRCACWPGGLDHDANSILALTQTDQNEPLASVRCIGPLEMP
jgi:hypothetical protein